MTDQLQTSASPAQVDDGATAGRPARGPWREAWRRFRRHRFALVSCGVLGFILLACVLGPLAIPYGPTQVDMAAADQAPSLAHPLGTDDLGRDQLVRVLVAGRLTIAVAVAAVAVAITAGATVGAVAGYLGGIVDNLLMRVVDVFYSLPGLFVVILLVTLVGPGFGAIVVAIGLLSWMNTARLVRASFLSLKQQEFVTAARTVGVSEWRIAVRHVLPNALGPVIVAATLGVATAILIESALSFLGLGFQPPRASWGGMLEASQRAVVSRGHWWRGLFPGLMILFTVLSVNYLGDALRDAFDPRRHVR